MILVTGASGFVGRALVPYLAGQGLAVRAASRSGVPAADNAEPVLVDDLGPDTDWSQALRGIRSVVHLAGLAHVLDPSRAHDSAPYMRANLEGTLRLATAAAERGIRRFVFLSSVKVHGSKTSGRIFSERDAPQPDDPYGESKWLAEQGLAEMEGLDSVILRPPLVYGPGVKANFLRLLDWTARGVPLPLGGIHNRRSFVGIGNLCAAIGQCVRHPDAPGHTFMVSDGEDLSTPQLIRRMAKALGTKARLLDMPPGLLGFAAKVMGRGEDWERLAGDLAVTSEKLRVQLQFKPPYSLDEGLAETAAWYRATRGG
jgi:nucleoside-diphosphate-sugar epimerase